jgi:hypothetical protein
MACFSNETCSASHACEVPFDMNATYTVQPVSAVIAPTNASGGPWDDLSDPDCGLDLFCPQNAGSTTATAAVQNDTFTPSWTSTAGTCRLPAMQLITAGFAFDAYDSDVLSNDTITGRTVVKPTQADLQAGTMTLTSVGGLNSIRFRFTTP